MKHNAYRVDQKAKKFPSFYETLQVISLHYSVPD